MMLFNIFLKKCLVKKYKTYYNIEEAQRPQLMLCNIQEAERRNQTIYINFVLQKITFLK